MMKLTNSTVAAMNLKRGFFLTVRLSNSDLATGGGKRHSR